MPANRKPIHNYPIQQSEPEKYVPSFFLDVPTEGKILRAEVRPLPKDKGYYTISLEGIFLGHIHKSGFFWTDFIGKTNEIYQMIGEAIEAHKKQ